MKTLEELRKLDIQQLLEELETTLQELFKVRFEVANGQSKSIHLVSGYRKQAARIKTIITESIATEVKKPTKKLEKQS